METNPRQQLMQLIQTAKPSELISSQLVESRFIDLYKTIHGIRDNNRAQAYWAAEKFHFAKLINDSAELKGCTNMSIYGVLLDGAVDGLSFDPSMKHVYVYSYNVNVGTREHPKWEKRASRQISPYGELLLRTLQGQIKYVDNPVVVYKGDDWGHGEKDGKKVVYHMAKSPRESDDIIAAYLKITRHDDTIDYKVLTVEEIQDLRKVSKSPNSSAWVKSFKGMCEAKVIKHAFKNYPKIRVGEFSKLTSDVVDTVPEHIMPDYGLTQEDFSQSSSQEEPPITQHEDENSFANSNQQQPAGVTHNGDDETF